ncbi:MAG: stage 0 sporulation family protein [Oscillospiraceae bacterium]|nr:stage 0 sporulation family protein [Oscillospiraceae bacterium]
MANVIGVRFRGTGKQYYFDPLGESFRRGDYVIVETARGLECGYVSLGSREVAEEKIVQPLKPVVRRAGEEDLTRHEANLEKEREAYAVCRRKIAEHGLEMKLVDVEYAFDSQKIVFYFTADGRVDFRELVKDLAGVFHSRIELRQIGVRDESRLLGGLGICGKELCCSTFLFEFHPVSIKMAKEQGKSLNPTKISGACGRLMCCLKYEQNVYDELLRKTPRNGSYVKTPDGNGTVVDSQVLARTVKVRLDDSPESPRGYSLDDIQVLFGNKSRSKKEGAENSDAAFSE